MAQYRLGGLLALSVFLAGCVPPGVLTAKHTVQPDTIKPAYVATSQYAGLTCDQIAAQTRSQSAVAQDMAGKLERGDYDKSGSLIVTPLFIMYDDTKVLDSTDDNITAFARLKGQLIALKEAARNAHCSPSTP